MGASDAATAASSDPSSWEAWVLEAETLWNTVSVMRGDDGKGGAPPAALDDAWTRRHHHRREPAPATPRYDDDDDDGFTFASPHTVFHTPGTTRPPRSSSSAPAIGAQASPAPWPFERRWPAARLFERSVARGEGDGAGSSSVPVPVPVPVPGPVHGPVAVAAAATTTTTAAASPAHDAYMAFMRSSVRALRGDDDDDDAADRDLDFDFNAAVGGATPSTSSRAPPPPRPAGFAAPSPMPTTPKTHDDNVGMFASWWADERAREKTLRRSIVRWRRAAFQLATARTERALLSARRAKSLAALAAKRAMTDRATARRKWDALEEEERDAGRSPLAADALIRFVPSAGADAFHVRSWMRAHATAAITAWRAEAGRSAGKRAMREKAIEHRRRTLGGKVGARWREWARRERVVKARGAAAKTTRTLRSKTFALTRWRARCAASRTARAAATAAVESWRRARIEPAWTAWASLHQARSIHWSPYDRVGVVDADP